MKVKKNEKQFDTDEAYYEDNEYITNSILKDFLFCEYLFQVKHIDKTFVSPRDGEPDYFIYGRAVDTILTEPEKTFEQKFIPMEIRIDIESLKELEIERDQTIKEAEQKEIEGKPHKMLDIKLAKLYDRIIAIKNIDNKTQLTKAIYKDIMASVQELKRQPLYEMFGVKERSQEIIALTIDGYKRKGKLDYIYLEKRIIIDVKTCANLENFDPRNYAGQLSYYRDLASVKYNIDCQKWDCYIAAAGKEAKFKRSEIFHITDNLLNAAQVENKAVLKLFVERVKSGFFNPVTANPANYLARKEKCFHCEHYPNCKFSLQKDITYIN